MAGWIRAVGGVAVVLLAGTGGAVGVPAEATKVRTEVARETAGQQARRTGVSVEIVSERTETARVFANPSGTTTLEQHVMPVRARRGGAWVPIDTRLARQPDGSVAPGATAVGLRFSGGGAGPLVTAAQDGTEMSLSWPSALPEPVLRGDVATYLDVLPDVDLRLRATSTGFTQVLVVKNAAAAGNPALRRIRFPVTTRGLTLRADRDGSSRAVDAAGRPVFVSGTPQMWDSPVAARSASGVHEPPAPRQRAMRLEVADGAVTVVPDATMLSDPDTRYPLYIDPSYSAARYRWTMVSKSSPTVSYWTDEHYREDMRVGETYDNGSGPWRTLFQFNVSRLARAAVQRAWVSVTMTHTGTCTESAVELWHTRTIDPASALTWNNSAGHWLGGSALDTRKGKANKSACGQPAQLMEFGISPDTVTPVVQEAVNGPAGPQEAVAFGLRIPSASEGNQDHWKRFDDATARLNIEFNKPPLAPTSVSTVPPTPCGTAVAPTALKTTNPIFTGVGYDPDADNVTNHLQILSGETVLRTEVSGTVGTGSAVRWPATPPGVLPEDQPSAVFSYRAYTRDGGLAGPPGQRCYFTVDTTRPGVPSVASTDFPRGTPVRAVGEAGVVTFARAAGDGDVVGFRYGFSEEATTMWVAAGADGRATVPLTLWPPFTGDPTDVLQTLYVRAVDRAGNASQLSGGWVLAARGRAVSSPPVGGDVNGDRRADVAAVVNHGHGRTAVWNLLSNGTGFHTGYIGWDTDVAGGFPAELTKSASGDFDGDGRTDMAVFREDPGGVVRLFLLRSDGSQFHAASEPVWSGNGWRLSHLKVVAGDFDADGDDDLAGLRGLAGGQTTLWLHTSNRGAFGAPSQQWAGGAGGLTLAQSSMVAGDFDGDGDDDVANVYDAGAAQARLLVHTANAGQLSAPAERWNSGAGGFDTTRARFTAGNVDGDAAGGDEVVALYDDGAATARMITLGSRGGAWSAATWWSSGAGAFDATKASVAVGDFDADGRADAATLSDAGRGVRRLDTFTSTGGAFAGRQPKWEGYVSEAEPAVRIDQTRRYRIHPRHTGKCFDVPGGSTANDAVLDQWDCVATATWETFRLEAIGAAPYVHLRTSAEKCLDVKAWSLQPGANVVQWPCLAGGAPQPNQLFELDDLGGGGQEPVVQLRVLHSDKCLQVSGASTANGAPIVQAACAGSPPTHQQFVLRLEPP